MFSSVTLMEEHIYSECYDDTLMEQLTLFYAHALKNLLFKVSRKLCYGCQEQHLSQTRHSCIMLTPQQKLSRYFYQTLHDLDESAVINRWEAAIDETDCPACLSQVKNVHNSIWRETQLKTDRWVEKLFQTVYRMIRLERKFYD